jgi:hypothetical protein
MCENQLEVMEEATERDVRNRREMCDKQLEEIQEETKKEVRFN